MRNRNTDKTVTLRAGRAFDTRAFVRRLEAAWRRASLLRPGDRVLVAVSGGPDSVALLAVLKRVAPTWHLQLRVLHLNYGLRGTESEEDAAFVRALCGRLGVSCVRRRVNLVGKRHGVAGSLQERARVARYGLLQREAERWQADRVAIGHTANDQAETVLLWMLRGAGSAGLAGIPPMRASLYVRPLLDVPRADILAFLRAEGLAYRRDSSNRSPTYLRNRIRHEVLPILQRLNPAVVDTLGRQANILRADESCLEALTVAQLGRLTRREPDGTVVVERAGLRSLPLALQRRLIRTVLRQMQGGFRGPSLRVCLAVLDRVVEGRSGAALTLLSGTVTREYEVIRFVPPPVMKEGESAPVVERSGVGDAIRVEDWMPILWRPLDQMICFSLEESEQEWRIHQQGRTMPTLAWFDRDRFSLPLVVRPWQPGDVIQPLGMGGHSKKIQDLFVDGRVPRPLRRRIPLLVAPEGILWVVGIRPDERFRVRAETRRVLKVEMRASKRQGEP